MRERQPFQVRKNEMFLFVQNHCTFLCFWHAARSLNGLCTFFFFLFLHLMSLYFKHFHSCCCHWQRIQTDVVLVNRASLLFMLFFVCYLIFSFPHNKIITTILVKHKDWEIIYLWAYTISERMQKNRNHIRKNRFFH